MGLWPKGDSIVLRCHICKFESSPRAGRFTSNSTHSP